MKILHRSGILLVVFMLTIYGFSRVEIIPRGVTISVDGTVTGGEWEDAVEYSIDYEAMGEAIVRLKHDGQHLYFLYRFILSNRTVLSFPEIYIDSLLNGGETWQSDDWWFHVSGTDCVSRGKPDDYKNCRIQHDDWSAVPNFKLGGKTEPVFLFEIAIPFSKIGIEKERAFGMALAGALFLEKKDGSQEFKALYPVNGNTALPSTWSTWMIQ